MKHIIVNAQLLTLSGPDAPRVGPEMRSLGYVNDGAVLFIDGKIAAAGLRDLVMRHEDAIKARIIDAGRRIVMPGFVDSHTHPVFAVPRLKDFDMRLRGKSYREIAEGGGGILSSVAAVRASTEADLAHDFFARAERFLECGTTTIEAKSGYGLELESELKMLRAIKHVSAGSALEIVPTFLGAHALPPEYRDRPLEYVRLLSEQWIPAVAREGLARFVDVFCEQGYFAEPEAELVLRAGLAAGLGVKVHAEQLSHSGGARLAGRLKACTADHLDHVDDEDLAMLKASDTIAALVPGSNHFLGLKDFPPARRIIDSGVPVALATDFNPGTCPCWNMQEIISIATTRMGMTAEEAIAAATINGAHALGLGKTHGSLETGKQADIVIMDCANYLEIPYWFGANLAAAVFKGGRLVHSTRDFRV